MPRSKNDLESRLALIVNAHINDLVASIERAVRQNVVTDLRGYLAGDGAAPRGAGRRAVKRRVLPCIAPGCGRPSKGPRFHYLCDEHMGARPADVEAWRAAQKTAGAAGK